MTRNQRKEYIKQVWNVSSGKKISAMLKKHFELAKKERAEKQIKVASRLFG